MAGTQYWGTARWGTIQHVAYTGTAGEITTAISTGVFKVRIIVTTAAFVRVSAPADTATSSDAYVAAGVPEYVTCSPGQKVSAMQVSSGGTLYVTECL